MTLPSVEDRGVYTVYLRQLMFIFCQNLKLSLNNVPFPHLLVNCYYFGVSFPSFRH